MNANNAMLSNVRKKSVLLRILAVLLIAVVAFASLPTISTSPYVAASSNVTQNQINDMQQRLENNRAEQERIAGELARLLRATGENEALLETIESLINEKISEIFGSEELIELFEQSIRDNENEIRLLEEESEILIENLTERLRALHENGNQNILTIINDSSSFFELIVAIERSVTRVDRDRRMVAELEEIQIRLDETAERLESQRVEQLRLRAHLEIQREELEVRQDELNDVIYQLNRASEENMALSDHLANSEDQYEREIEALIRRLEEQRQREEEERRRAEAAAAAAAAAAAEAERNNQQNSSNTNNGTNTNTTNNNPPPPINPEAGDFMWPLGFCQRARAIATNITSHFGNRIIFGRQEFHSGIDVGAQFGTPIFAAQCGVVLISQFSSGWGNYVVISHGTDAQGRSIQTLYAHAQRLDVRPGQQVSRGQQIATVGSTGRSTGPHLHFEVRVNGRAVAPLPFVQASFNRVRAGQPA